MTRRTATSELFNAYDVIIVPFPYVDRFAEKRRPALVISSAALATFGVLWVAMSGECHHERSDGSVLSGAT